MMRSRFVPLLVATALLWPLARLAAQSDDLIPDEIVVTAPPPAATPAPGTYVVTGEDARDRGARTVAEALQGAAAVTVQRQGARTEPAAVRLRGSAAEHVLVVVDGVRLSDSRSALVDVNTIPMERVEQIVVRTGPATAIYGSGGIAGVVEIETRGAVGSKQELTTRLSYGSFGTVGAGAEVIVPRDHGSIEARFSGTRAANGYTYARSGQTVTRTNAGLLSGSADIALRSRGLAGEWLLCVGAGAARRGVPGTVEFPSGTAVLEDADVNATAVHTAAPDGAAWYRAATVRAGYRRRSFSDRDYGLGDIASTAALTWGEAETTVGVEGRTIIDLTFGGRGEMLADESLGDRTRAVVSVAPGVSSPGGTPLQWSVSGRGEAELGTEPRRAAPVALWSARGELSWAPGRGRIRIGTAAGVGYRLPSFAELFWPASGFAVGNSSLAPERSTSIEGEIAVEPVPAVSGRFALYRTWYRELIQWLPDPTGVWKPRNTGDALTEGVEATVAVQRSLGLSPWSLEGSATGSVGRAVDRTDGPTRNKQLPYRPLANGSAAVTARHLAGHHVAVSANVVGARAVTAQNTAWIDPYAAVDVAGAIVVPGRGITVQTGVTNVLDERHVDTRFLPNPGREFVVAVEVAW